MNDANMLMRLFILSLAVWREARGESPLGKLLVAQTIKNRVEDLKARWPADYVGTVTQPFQFSAFNKSDPNALLFPHEDSPSWSESVAVSKLVLDGARPFTTANHYHAVSVTPRWADKTKIVAREGNHIFYEL